MKEKKAVKKPTSFLSILLYIALVVCPFAFLLNHFFPSKVEAVSHVSELVQSIITVIAGFWITCYLLFMQLYKDRYPLESLKRERLPHMRNNFILVFYDVIYGCLLAFYDYCFWGSICFLVLSLLTVAVIFQDVFNAHKTLMVSSYVDTFFKKVSTAFNAHTGTIDPAFLEEVKFILDESLVKEEYYTAQTIITQTGISFRDYLGNLIKISDHSGPKDVEKSFREVVDFNIKELELCKNLQSDLLVKALLNEQEENLRYCIDNMQYEWYKIYFHEFSVFVFKMQKEENTQLADKLYGIYYRLFKKLIKAEKEEWVNYSIDEIESLTFTYIYVFNKNNIQNYVMLLTEILELCVKKKYDTFYDTFFSKLSHFTEAKYIEHGAFADVKAFYASLFSLLLKENAEYAYNLVELLLKKRVRSHDDASLLEFKLYGIVELSGLKKQDVVYQNTMFNHHIDALVEVVSLKKDYSGYLVLPDFYGRIEKQDCPKETLEDTINAIKNLLHHCIVTDYLPPFYTLLKELRESLTKTAQKQKGIQQEILGIFFWLFRKTIVLANQQFFELTFDFFQQSLESMDKNRAISNDLGNFIISRIAKGHSATRRDNEKLTVLSIDLLFSFLTEGEEYYFVLSNSEQKKLLYRSLFNIGTECIENNFEEGLRRVSNSIGWLIIYSLKQTTHPHTTYLIKRAQELFYLAKKMDVSKKTQMFLLTLFTTVGSYCCKDPSYISFRDSIIDSIKDESIERVKIAVSLRTNENDMWKDLYQNQTEHLTKEFLKAFERKAKSNSSKS